MFLRVGVCPGLDLLAFELTVVELGVEPFLASSLAQLSLLGSQIDRFRRLDDKSLEEFSDLVRFEL